VSFLPCPTVLNCQSLRATHTLLGVDGRGIPARTPGEDKDSLPFQVIRLLQLHTYIHTYIQIKGWQAGCTPCCRPTHAPGRARSCLRLPSSQSCASGTWCILRRGRHIARSLAAYQSESRSRRARSSAHYLALLWLAAVHADPGREQRVSALVTYSFVDKSKAAAVVLQNGSLEKQETRGNSEDRLELQRRGKLGQDGTGTSTAGDDTPSLDSHSDSDCPCNCDAEVHTHNATQRNTEKHVATLSTHQSAACVLRIRSTSSRLSFK
jgi:hypothetical protein